MQRRAAGWRAAPIAGRSPFRGVAIELEKRLPMGGGVGGGSSDAATTLVALNELWGLDLPVDDLAALGLELGADVPVFVLGQAAWAEGVGERLTARRLPGARLRAGPARRRGQHGRGVQSP